MDIARQFDILSIGIELSAGEQLRRITDDMIAVGIVATAVEPNISLPQRPIQNDPIEQLIDEAMTVKGRVDAQRLLAGNLRRSSDELKRLLR